jgi:hypothetical protein
MSQQQLRRVSSFIATATLAAVVTAFIGWPSHVNADGKSKAAARQQTELAVSAGAPQNAALANNQAKIGELIISAELAASDTTPGGRVIHLECRNPTAQTISGNIQLELTRTRGVAMERVMPQPQIAWRHPESVSVEPGQTLTRDIPLPKDMGGEVARIDKARERAENSDSVPYPNTYYAVVATPVERGGAGPQQRANTLKKSNLARTSEASAFGY